MFMAWYTYNNGKSAVGFNSETADGLVKVAAYYKEYYNNLYPGTGTLEVTKRCTICNGDGHITQKRKNPYAPKKVCKHCKGVGALELTDDEKNACALA